MCVCVFYKTVDQNKRMLDYINFEMGVITVYFEFNKTFQLGSSTKQMNNIKSKYVTK